MGKASSKSFLSFKRNWASFKRYYQEIQSLTSPQHSHKDLYENACRLCPYSQFHQNIMIIRKDGKWMSRI